MRCPECNSLRSDQESSSCDVCGAELDHRAADVATSRMAQRLGTTAFLGGLLVTLASARLRLPGVLLIAGLLGLGLGGLLVLWGFYRAALVADR